MNKLAMVVAALLATAGCKKEPKAAAKPAEPPAPAAPVQNAATQYTDGLQKGMQKADDVAAKANAAIQQNNQAITEATGE